jgi:uncharacterized membrane protein
MEEITSFVAFILALFLFTRFRALNKRVLHLEERLKGAPLPAADSPTEQAPPQPHGDVPLNTHPLAAPNQAISEPQQTPEHSGALGRLGAWLKEDWLMKVGAFLIIIGLGWFLSYAIAEGLIGEVGRITIGLLVGAALLILGNHRMRSFPAQGSIVMFLGATAVILTLYVARLYDFFTPASVLILMFLTSCLLGLTSIRFNRPQLAYANVGLAGMAPLLTVTPDPSILGLLTYLLVLVVGSVWVALVTGRTGLILFSFGIVSLFTLPLLGGPSSSDQDLGLLFAFLFTAIYFGASLFSMRIKRATTRTDVITALLVSLYLFAWIVGVVPDEFHSLLLVMWTFVFAFGAFLAVRMGAARAYFYTYAAVGITYLGAATAIELDGPVLAIVMLAEASAVLVLALSITREVRHIPLYALPFAVPILLSFLSISSSAWHKGVVHGDALVLLLMIAAFMLFALHFDHMYARVEKPEDKEALRDAEHASWMAAGAYMIVFVWLFSHAVFRESTDMGTLLALLLYTFAALVAYMVGRITHERWQRRVAVFLIGIVLLDLLFVEVWKMSTTGKTVTFLLVGALLLGTAWLERNTFDMKRLHKPNDTEA